jgi:hypothetical protein
MPAAPPGTALLRFSVSAPRFSPPPPPFKRHLARILSESPCLLSESPYLVMMAVSRGPAVFGVKLFAGPHPGEARLAEPSRLDSDPSARDGGAGAARDGGRAVLCAARTEGAGEMPDRG